MAVVPITDLSTSNTGTNARRNSDAIQKAIDICAAAGGGYVEADRPGLYEVCLRQHPNTASSGWSTCVAAFKPNVILRGIGRDLVTLKVTANPNAGLQNGGQNRFFMNWNPNAAGNKDSGFGVQDITLDGNCKNVGSGSGTGSNFQIMHGIQWWYVRNAFVKRVVIKNMRGNNASTEEVFHCDALRSQDIRLEDVICLGDDGGNTSSGFSMNWVDRFWATRCVALGMKTGQGYTWYSSGNGFTTDCYAGDTGRYGFNIEHCWDVHYVNCDGGGEAPISTSGNPPVTFTPDQPHPNGRSYMINMTQGGGRIWYTNCTARNGKEANIGIIGTHGGRIHWNGGTISGGAKGVQYYDATPDDKRKSIRNCDFTTAHFVDNVSCDFEDIGHESDNTCGREVFASGAATPALTGYMKTGVEFPNPFPFDMRVTTPASAGGVSIRGANPKDSLTSTGQKGQSVYHVPVGGSILTDGPTTGMIWWYPR